MIFAFAVPVMAASGASVVSDDDGRDADDADTNGWNGTVSIDGTSGVHTFDTTGADGIEEKTSPDSAVGGRNHTANLASGDGQEIDVEAQIIDGEKRIRYNIEIAWGDMQFVYSRAGEIWNPTTHKYVVDPTATGKWVVEDYLDNNNNRIVVANHSNSAVNTSFTYANEAAAFNAALGADNVTGGFYASAAAAQAAALWLTFPTGQGGYNAVGTTAPLLYTADGRDPAKITPAGGLTYTSGITGAPFATEAFFTFSGTPDASKTITTMTKVGTITVVVTPNFTAGAHNTKGTDVY